jgi:MFS family permease
MINHHTKKLALSILSLSLLTVMAGAAVAPALGVMRKHFYEENPLLIQMIISMPAIFIFFTNLIFPKLCYFFRSRTLVMSGLLLYTIGGCAAGGFHSIYAVLAARALVGIGVGIIMPLSTGLLAFYFLPDQQEKLMGYSSAMNQMGGVIATLLAGLLASVSWRASFLVYLMGLISIILCLLFLPNDDLNVTKKNSKQTAKNKIETSFPKQNRKEKISLKKSSSKNQNKKKEISLWHSYYPYIIGMFFLMISFFIYPANFAMETSSSQIIPQKFIAVIMAFADFIAFFGGLFFVQIKTFLGRFMNLLAPALFVLGYILLLSGGWAGAITGSFCIGLANGTGIPFLIVQASQKAGKRAASTILPLLSAALYLSQFSCPALLSLLQKIDILQNISHLPYWMAISTSLLFLVWSFLFVDVDFAPKNILQGEQIEP